MKVQYYCRKCGSDHVGRDAFCDWNTEKQTWEVANFTGEAFCHQCADSTDLEEKPIQSDDTIGGNHANL